MIDMPLPPKSSSSAFAFSKTGSGWHDLRVPSRTKQWQVQVERCSHSDCGFEIHRTIHQLQNFIRHCQADSAARLFGGEVEVIDLVANVGSDAGTFIANGNVHLVAQALGPEPEVSTFRHGLHAVKHHVEECLLQ